MSEWISVKDRLPPNDDDVLVFDERKRFAVSCYFLWGKTYHWEKRDDELGDVTHWMDLPSPPNKDEA